jgi:Tol biopolymer transport system component
VPAGPGLQTEPSWYLNGQKLVYVQGANLMVVAPNVNGCVPGVIDTPAPGFSDHDPAFAPTPNALVVAFIQRGPSGTKLCFSTRNAAAPSLTCTGSGGWDLGRQVAWSPDGKTILVFGARNGGTQFGLLAYITQVAYSPNRANWIGPTLVTNASVAGVGVIAGAFSPNGKQMALVSNAGGNGFEVYVVPVGDYNPTLKQDLGVAACQVSWRPDGQALAVMQAANGCSSNPPGATVLGAIVTFNLGNPSVWTRLAGPAADPVWQPVPTGG